jgi:hypothetical protein
LIEKRDFPQEKLFKISLYNAVKGRKPKSGLCP